MKRDGAGWVWQGAGGAALLLTSLAFYGALVGGSPTPDLLAAFGPDQIARAEAYQRARYIGFLTLVGLEALLFAWLFWHPLGRRLTSRVCGDTRPWLAAARAGAAIFGVAALLSLPLSYYLGVIHESRFDLMHPSPADWLIGHVIQESMALIFGAVALATLYALITRWPERWWVPAGLLLTAWLLTRSMLGPILLDPLFYSFRPLTDPTLTEAIEEVVDRAGVPAEEFWVLEVSDSTERVNAYVTGVGPHQRIVLYDTLIERLTAAEVTYVVAHELAHRHHLHPAFTMVAVTGGSLLFLFMLSRLLTFRRHGSSATLAHPADARGVPAVLLAVLLVSFLTVPAGNAASRALERQADQTAVAWTGDPETAASVHQTLAVTNLSDLTPHPLVYAVFFTHPAASERIASTDDRQAAGLRQTHVRDGRAHPTDAQNMSFTPQRSGTQQGDRDSEVTAVSLPDMDCGRSPPGLMSVACWSATEAHQR